jgi:CxxC-x17-CxxC domain-containing protein
MKNSNRDNRSSGAGGGRKFRGTDSGNRSFGSRGDNRRFGDRDSGRPLRMHKAICNECGKECELPFKPTGDKPVFCSNCFRNKENLNRSSGRDSRKKFNFQEKRMYSAICTECGNKCEVPFRPTGGKPIYCSNCFGKGDNTGGKNTEQFKEQFETLNAKLDNILKLLTPIVSTEVAREQKVTRETGVPKTKKVAKQQTKRTVSPKKTIKKEAVTKRTVAKKVTRKKKN